MQPNDFLKWFRPNAVERSAVASYQWQLKTLGIKF